MGNTTDRGGKAFVGRRYTWKLPRKISAESIAPFGQERLCWRGCRRGFRAWPRSEEVIKPVGAALRCTYSYDCFVSFGSQSWRKKRCWCCKKGFAVLHVRRPSWGWLSPTLIPRVSFYGFVVVGYFGQSLCDFVTVRPIKSFNLLIDQPVLS